MEPTQQLIKKLEQHLASGVLTVRHGERVLTFATADDMLKRIEYFKDELHKQQGQRRITRLHVNTR